MSLPSSSPSSPASWRPTGLPTPPGRPGLQLNSFDAIEISRLACERRLKTFMKQAWRYIDPATFIDNWHIDAICEHLEAVARGEILRLLINIPPRHMKSLTCAVAFPAWVWAQRPKAGSDGVILPTLGPHTQFLYMSYAAHLSIRDNRKTRELIQTSWYQQRWGNRFQIKKDENQKTKFENDKNGRRLASSVGGIGAGEGGSIIVVDDPHNFEDGESETIREGTLRWFDETLQSRLNDPKRGAFVVNMQRIAERDLSGHILAKELGYVHLCLPARYEANHPHVWRGTPQIVASKYPDGDPRHPDAKSEAGKDVVKGEGALLWPARFGDKEIDALELAMGAYGAAGQLYQRPAPRSGGFFSRSWFAVLDEMPRDADGNPIRVVRRIRAWDLAATKDTGKLDPSWTVGVLISKLETGIFVIEHVERFRENPHEVEARIRKCAQIDGRDVTIWLPQDPGQAGKHQIEYLVRALAGYVVKFEIQSGDKAKRAEPMSSQAQANNIKLLRGTWNNNFLDELCSFPMGRHNDQVDAAAYAFNKLVGPGNIAMIFGGGRS
ncbi:MAG: phage terminase large subunit [Bacteroidota bacterium]